MIPNLNGAPIYMCMRRRLAKILFTIYGSSLTFQTVDMQSHFEYYLNSAYWKIMLKALDFFTSTIPHRTQENNDRRQRRENVTQMDSLSMRGISFFPFCVEIKK